MLGWRGLFAIHIIFADAWLLFGRTRLLPLWLISHWAAEGIWLMCSICGIAIGWHELLDVSEGWVGSCWTPPPKAQMHATNSAAVLATLGFNHLVGVGIAPSDRSCRC